MHNIRYICQISVTWTWNILGSSTTSSAKTIWPFIFRVSSLTAINRRQWRAASQSIATINIAVLNNAWHQLDCLRTHPSSATYLSAQPCVELQWDYLSGGSSVQCIPHAQFCYIISSQKPIHRKMDILLQYSTSTTNAWIWYASYSAIRPLFWMNNHNLFFGIHYYIVVF